MLTDRHTQHFWDKAAKELKDLMHPEKASWCVRKSNGALNFFKKNLRIFYTEISSPNNPEIR